MASEGTAVDAPGLGLHVHHYLGKKGAVLNIRDFHAIDGPAHLPK